MNDSAIVDFLTPPGTATTALKPEALDAAIAAARDALLARQRPDGHWVFDFEADATIPAEYVLLVHFLGEAANAELETKIGAYLRRIQGAHGGWPLFNEGEFDMSASVKAYFALKMIGDTPDAPHMRRAREAILARGGAEHSNVFTRILLALFGIVTWRAVPVMPVEIMLLPRWFPFHLSKISYWARTVIVPLLVLQAKRARAKNPLGISIDELFTTPPDQVGMAPRAPHQNPWWFRLFRVVDAVLRAAEPIFPARTRQRSVERAVEFVTERLNGEDGLGAIFPAMANSVMMYDALGIPPSDPRRAIARTSVDKLLLVGDDEAYCQPCLSPVWDTALAAHALLETGDACALDAVVRGLEWLRPRQILDVVGDWAVRRPDVRPGGWAFQYANPHYPDVDDTAVVVAAMDRVDKIRGAAAGAGQAHGDTYADSIARAREWVIGMQSSDGGWGAFEPENTHDYLNNIPFSDHGALLDPPTADVSARCLSMLAQLGAMPGPGPGHDQAATRALGFVLRHQEANGSWFGRWGANYIYGTWSALCALNGAGYDPGSPAMRRAANWLLRIQNEDGGWGEDCSSYRLDYNGHAPAPSTASQTAWALLGLMAAGDIANPALERGFAWLLRTQRADGSWTDALHNAPGFPRVFYLLYHGYAKFFPLWALARYRDLTRRGIARVRSGL